MHPGHATLSRLHHRRARRHPHHHPNPPHDGLRIIKDPHSLARLQLSLNAVPPRRRHPPHHHPRPHHRNFRRPPRRRRNRRRARTQNLPLATHLPRRRHQRCATTSASSKTNPPTTPQTPLTPQVRPVPARIPRPLWADYSPLPAFHPRHQKPRLPRCRRLRRLHPRRPRGGRWQINPRRTNLNDTSGPGSLRRLPSETPGPRTHPIRSRRRHPSPLHRRHPRTPSSPSTPKNAPSLPESCSATSASKSKPTTSSSAIFPRPRQGDDNVLHRHPRPAAKPTTTAPGEHALYFIEGSKNCIADSPLPQLVYHENPHHRARCQISSPSQYCILNEYQASTSPATAFAIITSARAASPSTTTSSHTT